MGKIIQLPFYQMLPGENSVWRDSMARVVQFADLGGKLLAVPVRKHGSVYVNLDGRHRLIYHYLNGARAMALREINLLSK